ncbi:MAG: methyltransferase domain-containing protein [Desulfobacteraceae bacterium]|nr:methyltransferase domain-containing protein [Desulfobacteraceae bacterium]
MDTAINITEEFNLRQRDQFMGRMIQSTSGYFDILTIYLGERLGLYRALDGQNTLTSEELAARTGTYERYIREWLEQQTVAGIIEVIDSAASPQERRYQLPAGHAEVLLDRESVNYLAPITRLLVGISRPLPSLIEDFRTGRGLPWETYDEDAREGVAELNRPLFLQQLGQEYLPIVKDVHRRLQADPPARVADMGCGLGWSSIGLANAYPKIKVDGFDIDSASIEAARVNTKEAYLEDRVRFYVRDAGDASLKGKYDLVTAFECIHDMADPVAALRTMLDLAGPDGSVIVMDERTAETFTPQGNEIEALLYGFSILTCLPTGMAEHPSVETGTVMRPDTLRRYAAEAGFCDVEILPIDNFFFRFYRLKTVCG